MGVDCRIETGIVTLRVFGRADLLGLRKSWTEKVREAAEHVGPPILLLVKLEPDLELPSVVLGAGVRDTFGILPLLRAVAMVATHERKQAMLRASVVAVAPQQPVRLFSDEEEARAWLLSFKEA